MAGRRRWFALALVLLVVGAGVALAVSDGDPEDPTTAEPDARPAPPPPDYANPLVEGSSRNPSVLRAADGTYYAYVDGIDLGGAIPVVALTSSDLATWTLVSGFSVDPGTWADPSSGSRFTSPSVRYVPDNPAASRYVMYLTGPTTDGSASCIGVATAAAPEGPFVGADQPLVCPPGGARAASPVPRSDQIVYRAETPTPGVYVLTLDAAGTAVAPGAEPSLLLGVAGGIGQEGVLERPAVARDPDGGTYLFARTGGPADGVSWSPCRTAGTEVVGCADRTHFGTWLAPTPEVAAIGGLQTFTDGDGEAWIAYDAQPASACIVTTCTGIANLRIDRLCFAHGQPRTDGPSTGTRPTARTEVCAADVPGADLEVASVDDGDRVDQPWGVTLREAGQAVPLGGRLLWLFSDTYLDPYAVALGAPCYGQGASRSNTAGLGLPHPLAGHRGYTDPLGALTPDDPCPRQFIPLTEDENLFNFAQAGVGRRYVAWRHGAIPLDDGSALVFFVHGVQDRDADAAGPDPGCIYCIEKTNRGQGVVRVMPGQTTADRASTPVGCVEACLFGPEDGWSGMPFLVDGFVYAYSDTPESADIRLGRVPLEDVLDRSAWTFRTAVGGWSPSITDAAAVTGLAVKPPAVAYNAHLDRFVTVANVVGNEVAIQTAPEPWGPWSEPTPIYDWSTVECADADSSGAVAIPWLDDGGGRVMRFAFSRAGPNFGRDALCPGEVRLVTVTLER